MNLLIITVANDLHANAVEWVLLNRGHHVVTWISPDFPVAQQNSINLTSNGKHRISLQGAELAFKGQHFDSVWLRRPGLPILSPNLHPADHQYVQRESEAFLRNINYLIGQDAFWVNPPQQRSIAELKIAQLKIAAECGFIIPPTLMSNHAADIRDFAMSHHGNVVFKTFYPTAWNSDSGRASLLTSKVPLESLENEFAVTSCPGIYQPLIEKAYEIRLTVMGEHFFAVKLYSQERNKTATDWRGDFDREMQMEPIQVPAQITAKCCNVMSKLGIVFGCFDFIVTPEGQYVFLEVNEMGQFTWVEKRCPELKMLDAFAQLLVSGRKDFSLTPDAQAVSLQNYLQSKTYEYDRTIRSTLHTANAPNMMRE